MLFTGSSVRLMQEVPTNGKEVRISAGEVATLVYKAPREQVVVQVFRKGHVYRALIDQSLVRSVAVES